VIFTVFVVPLMVTVSVALLNVPALESQLPGTVKEGDPLIVSVPPLLTVTLPLVPVPVVDPMFRSVPVMVSPPESVKTAATLIASLAVTVPETVRLSKPAVPFSLTVLLLPERVTVLVPLVNVPALEFQLPEHVHAPLVKLNVVPVPTVTSRRVTVEVLAVRPPVPTRDSDGPPVMLLPLVVRVPDPDVASVLLTSSALVRIETVPEMVRL
jgi:hypothetical protein